MKSYDEISNRIMKRGDNIIEARKVRAARIRHISYAVSGICAVLIVGFGVWKLSPTLKKPDIDHSDIIITTETTTESTTAVTASESVSVTSTNAKTGKTTMAVKTTAAAASTAVNRTTTGVTAANSIKTTAVHRTAVSTQIMTTTKADTKTTVVTSVSTTKIEPLTTSKEKHTTAPLTTTSAKVQTENPQTGVVVVTTSTVTTEIKHQGGVATSDDTNFRMFHESTATVAIEKNDTSVNYEKQNILIENERIGDFIAVKTINALLPDGTKWILHFGVYKISDIDMEEAVAVRFVNPFGFTQGYFMFTDPNYNKADDTLINDS